VISRSNGFELGEASRSPSTEPVLRAVEGIGMNSAEYGASARKQGQADREKPQYVFAPRWPGSRSEIARSPYGDLRLCGAASG
jgi:hypothetical protein